MDLTEIPAIDGMLVFKSEQELSAALLAISRMDRAALDAWEREIGFVSQRNLFAQLIDSESKMEEEYEHSGETPPEHSEMYYKFLESGLIKVVADGTKDEHYDYNIGIPGLETVVNYDGIVAVGDIIYQVTDRQIKKMTGGRFEDIEVLKSASLSDSKNNVMVAALGELATQSACSNVTQDSGWDYGDNGKKRIKVSRSFTSSQFLANGTQWKVTHNINVKLQKKNFWGNWVYSSGEVWVAGDWSGHFRLEGPVFLNTFFDYYGNQYAYPFHPNSISNLNASISIISGNSSPYPTPFLYQYQYNGNYIRILDICMDSSYWKAESQGGLRATVGTTTHPKCLIGSFDSANCYVGKPPTSTIAFIYSNNFYYTPVPGPVCPYPGSSYDGANCFVAAIPNGSMPFIYQNGWYVTPY